VDERLRIHVSHGRLATIGIEWLGNSGHFPLAVTIAYLCRWGSDGIFIQPQPMLGLIASVIQAVIVGAAAHAGRPIPVLGNLIAPFLFTIALAACTGLDGLRGPETAAFWLFAGSVSVARLIQGLRWRWLVEAAVVGEHVVRALILVAAEVVYHHAEGWSLAAYLSQGDHILLCCTAIGLGVLLGTAQALRLRQEAQLKRVAAELAEYSEWLLGRTMLNRALTERHSLVPSRSERTALFLDIRGFTRWSESRPPEEVMAMLASFYCVAEQAWKGARPMKVKFTADEIFLVFAEPVTAAEVALRLRDTVQAHLASQALGVGIGLHHGPVTEGLLGTERTKAFDVIGDTVNTAKRICDSAPAGTVLVSFPFYEACDGRIEVGEMASTRAKGKTSAVILAPLLKVRPAPDPPFPE
jgi:adenylate cyclase